MKKYLFIVAAFGISFFSGCNKNDNSKIVKHSFPKNQWVAGLLSQLSGLKIHLNNYTATKYQFVHEDNYAYENPKSSVIVLGTDSIPFDIDVYRHEPYSIYINDMNSTRLQGDAHDGLAFITINFESNGTEIIGDCVSNLACLCTAPQLDLSSIVTLMPIALGIKNSAISLEAQDTKFSSVITESGPCVNNFCAFLCDLVAPDKNSEMLKAIANYMEVDFNQKSDLIAFPFNQYLKNLGVTGPIVSVKIETNGDLTIQDKE